MYDLAVSESQSILLELAGAPWLKSHGPSAQPCVHCVIQVSSHGPKPTVLRWKGFIPARWFRWRLLFFEGACLSAPAILLSLMYALLANGFIAFAISRVSKLRANQWS